MKLFIKDNQIVQPEACKNVGQWWMCIYQRAVRRICCCPGRTGSFILLNQIREKVQDVIWKKIIAAWPHSFARLGGKKNIVPPSSSWNRDIFWHCLRGSLLWTFSLSCFAVLQPYESHSGLLTVSHFFCPNTNKLLYLNSSACISLCW